MKEKNTLDLLNKKHNRKNKFYIGERIKRNIEGTYVYKYGVVINVYSREARIVNSNPDITLPEYKELYVVEWDNGVIGKGYLPHGLISVTHIE